MKKILTVLIFLVSFAGSKAEIEFAGVFFLNGVGSFSLISLDTGAKSGWVREGQSFQGYRVGQYDRETEVLLLVGDEKHLNLKLRPSVVQSERITIRGKLKIGADTEFDIANALLVVGEETRFKINDKTWVRVKVEPARRGPPPGAVAPIASRGGEPLDGTVRPERPAGQPTDTLYTYHMTFEEEGDDGSPILLAAPRVTTPSDRGFTITQDDYSFSYEP